jgi:hypothetical protein
LTGGKTLEPQMVSAAGREALNAVLGTKFSDDAALEAHMTSKKTAWALKILEADETVTMPGYICDAVA